MAAAAVASSSTPRPLRLAQRGAVSAHASHHVSAPPHRSRRPRLSVSASAGVEGTSGSERFYFNFTGFPFPLGPFLNRRTIRTEVTSRPPVGRLAFCSPAATTGLEISSVFLALVRAGHWIRR